MIKKGKFAVEKVKYKDGIGCCIWEIIDKKNPGSGLAWDFSYSDLDTVIELLQKLKTINPVLYKDKEKKK